MVWRILTFQYKNFFGKIKQKTHGKKTFNKSYNHHFSLDFLPDS